MWPGHCRWWGGSLSWRPAAACARVMAGHSQVLSISGEADIGKTRLVEELCEMAASITEAVLARASGVSAETRAMVGQVSVADGGMTHELLADTVQLPEERVLACVRETVAAGLLTVAATATPSGTP